MTIAVPLITSTQRGEDLLFSTLIQLIIMIGAARIMNRVLRRFGQPGVVGEIVAGLLLGPSLLGHFFPSASAAIFGAKASPPIVILSQLGLMLLMCQIGMSFEFGHLRGARARRGLLPIAAASVLVPFGLGIWIGHLSAPFFAGQIPVSVYALFCGVALAITAVPILGRILAEYGMLGHELGVLGFGLLCWFLLRPAAQALLRKFPVVDGEIPPTLMAVVLAGIFGLGMCTYLLGIFTIFGGFAAGLLLHQDRAFVEAWRRQVGAFVMVFFLPIFFTFTGLRTNLLGLTTGTDWMWLAVFLATGVFGKIIPVYIVSRLSGYNGAAALLIGALMNTRALMELIVLNIGFETGFLPQKVFTMLVIMAVVTTLMTGPLLRVLIPKLDLALPRFVEA